jgi:hypothetical protein
VKSCLNANASPQKALPQRQQCSAIETAGRWKAFQQGIISWLDVIAAWRLGEG